MKTCNVMDDYKNLDITRLVEGVGPDKAIWTMVIVQAMRDCKNKKAPKIHQESAHEFLSGQSGALQIVCKYLDVRYTNVLDWYYGHR